MTIVGGVLLGVALKLVMKAIVLPLLAADPINHAYSYLIDDSSALPGTLATVVIGGGIGDDSRLWAGMFAHAAFDVTAVQMIYWNAEAKIAHLVFHWVK